MIYRPRLPNGKPAPLPWPVTFFRLTNNICWPLEDNASWFAYTFDRFFWLVGFVIFALTNDAELRYLRLNINNLDSLLTGVPTYFVLIEIHLRSFTLGLRKERFKKLLQKFYNEIYIEQSAHPKIFRSIQRQSVPVLAFSLFYVFTFITYVIIPIYLLSTGSRELLYKMITPFDYTPLYIYIPCILSNVWVGLIVTTMIYGEANTLAALIFHLNGRYLIMRENLNDNVDKILKTEGNGDIALKFRRILEATVKENVKLNRFAQQIQDEFSLRLFITFSFMAASLCALGFKVYTSPMTSIGYIFWTIGKVQEVLVYGQVGSSILTITDTISAMYYESKWEAVLERSSDVRANVHFMKLVNLAILTNRKPFYLTGLNFFGISLISAVTVIYVLEQPFSQYPFKIEMFKTSLSLWMLQGAGSYFTCLISFR